MTELTDLTRKEQTYRTDFLLWKAVDKINELNQAVRELQAQVHQPQLETPTETEREKAFYRQFGTNAEVMMKLGKKSYTIAELREKFNDWCLNYRVEVVGIGKPPTRGTDYDFFDWLEKNQ